MAQHKPRDEAKRIGMEILKQVGLEHKADSYPITMSGGQQQRIGIARALAVNPHAILLDEPTSALDPELVTGVLQVIKSIAEKQTTMIIVTHEMAFAKEVADQVILWQTAILSSRERQRNCLTIRKTNGRNDLSSRWESLQSLYKKERRTMADKAFHTRLINMRRDLHEHPELSFQEMKRRKKSAAGLRRSKSKYLMFLNWRLV